MLSYKKVNNSGGVKTENTDKNNRSDQGNYSGWYVMMQNHIFIKRWGHIF